MSLLRRFEALYQSASGGLFVVTAAKGDKAGFKKLFKLCTNPVSAGEKILVVV